MKVPFVDLSEQYNLIKSVIDRAIKEAFGESMFIGGAAVETLETELARLLTRDHCITCGNGTDGLEIAMEALGITKGDEVLVPALSWISTASSVMRVGGQPVFVDVDPEYYTMDPVDAKNKITAKTKAIMPVHLYGLPAPMEPIAEIATEFNLFIIEDCAQAIMAAINKKLVGSFGDVGVLSFYPTKNLGAYGDAGAIIASDDELAQKCRSLTNLGQLERANPIMIGRNSRMDSLQAALVNAKISFLEEWTAKRRRVARLYNNYFADINVSTPRVPANFKHVFYAYVIQVDDRDGLAAFLSSHGITTQIHYPKALSDMEIFNGKASCPIATQLASKVISLPLYPELSDEQINFVAKKVKEFVLKR